MRVLAVIALAMLLAGCEGDRIKQGKGDEGMARSCNVDATTAGLDAEAKRWLVAPKRFHARSLAVL